MGVPAPARMNMKRLWETIDRSGVIGAEREGGLSRPALTDADKAMRDQFVTWCREARLDVSVDRLGSIYGRRAGRDNSLPPVLIGGHLDTQANAGRFDGILGLMAGLELVRTLNDLGHVTRRPIEIVDWTNEKGSRFSPAMAASGAFAGIYEEQWVLDRPGDDGPTLGEELERIGYAGDAPVGDRPVDSYFELQIEQGPVLDARNIQIGICTGAMYATGHLVEFQGETAHTNSCPMERRRNALLAGARLVCAVDDLGRDFAGTGGKATAARLVAWPNKAGIISDWAQVIVDCRHENPEQEAVMSQRLHHAIMAAGASGNCDVRLLDSWTSGGAIFDEGLNHRCRRKAEELGYNHLDMVSATERASCFMARVFPTCTILVPCRDGVTHHNTELATPDQAAPGAQVFLHAVVDHADR